ncbi:hypothetical protein BEWA_035430 [Theileria equi strain WA]|uniref:RNA-editing substrate-binding complex 6 protein domain-containing protein n=1 Tax=Theileria equi strain WA TaxID=1537102 RepID=L1LDI0_THEEQ|nr:hypothetical protein BEWA_035430 [Theileria equi strain WA]EKX73507.1 hypothetical protein BEWA_035430 [Theileria equi strain WA]|eukprot:XP_004832959.1 hypothetical protein BEWA_035430 [Theileria equi strain WA]
MVPTLCSRCIHSLRCSYLDSLLPYGRRFFGTRQERHEYTSHFKTIPLSSLSKDFITVPIHHQDYRELLKTIVKGGKASISNKNFWKKCAKAFLYNRHHFTAKELVKIVNAFGRAKYDDPVLFNQIASLLLENQQNLSITDIPIILHACSEVGYHNKELFGRLYSVLSENVDRLGRHGIVMAIHAAKSAESLDILSRRILESVQVFTVEVSVMCNYKMSL